MDVVVNFISDFFHAYWFCILWGAGFGWIAFKYSEESKPETKIGIRKKVFSFSKSVLKNRRNAPSD